MRAYIIQLLNIVSPIPAVYQSMFFLIHRFLMDNWAEQAKSVYIAK